MAVQAQPYAEGNQCFPFPYSMPYSQQWMEVGGGFFDSNHPYIQQLQTQQQGFFVNGQASSSEHLISMDLSDCLAAQVERQRQDIDQYIEVQNERLRASLQQQRKQQLAFLIRGLEAKAGLLLRQKEDDIAKAKRKTEELEDWLRRVEMEKQTWQRMAKEKEALALALNNTLEQMMREKLCFSSAAAEDAESCCDFSVPINASDEEKIERERERERKISCKACNFRDSCVLILPCRHLSSCKACYPLLDSCPVCKSVKKASIEVNMF